MATGQKGEKFKELEECVSSCLCLQHPRAQGKHFKTVFSFLKLATNPYNSLRNIYEKHSPEASLELVHFSNTYKCDAFHSEGLYYSYFAL